MVHNLRMMNWREPDKGFDWAIEMNEKFKTLIQTEDHNALLNYESLGPASKLSIPTPDHYFPLIYSLGIKDKKESVEIFNDKLAMGSISMTSLKIS